METDKEKLERNKTEIHRLHNLYNRTSNQARIKDIKYAIFSLKQENNILEYNILNS